MLTPAPPQPDTATAFTSQPAESRRRIFWLDLIRVVAVFAVVVLHVAAIPVSRFRVLPPDEWWWAQAYDSLVRPCIPLFVMVSGALLLTQRDWQAGHFLRRRLVRVAVPFVAWSALYAVWNYVFYGKPTSAGQFLYHLAAGMADPVAGHLWYVPVILGLYLLVPGLRIYVLHSSAANQLYFAALWFAASCVRPIIETASGLWIGYYLEPVVGYVGYFVLGATCTMFLPERIGRRWLIVCGILFVVGYAVTLDGTYLLTVRKGGTLDETFYSHFSPSVIAMSLTGFVLLRDFAMRVVNRDNASGLATWIGLVSMVSFGLYLVHMMVFDLLNSGLLGFALGPLSFHPAFAVPLTSLGIFLASFAIAAVLRLSWWLRWLVP